MVPSDRWRRSQTKSAVFSIRQISQIEHKVALQEQFSWQRAMMALVKARQVGKRSKFTFDDLSQGYNYFLAAKAGHFVLLDDDEKFEVQFLTAAIDALA
ncbi:MULTISPECIES: hypothetical protein [unclassified Sinorhizobium]|uniref:hypothetical protein n=1 Tax=unclassified Sinorhizobium TaxID=2613772 RepID=UPI003525BC11